MPGELFTVNSKVAAPRKVSPDWSHCLLLFPLFHGYSSRTIGFLSCSKICGQLLNADILFSISLHLYVV